MKVHRTGLGSFGRYGTGTILAIGLFLFYSLARERLVPFGADPERAAWRLSGDEPAYLLTAQAIASGDGENVRHVHARGTYTNFQRRAVIGANYGTWGYYLQRKARHVLDRSAAWGEKQVVHRPPLIAVFCAPFAVLNHHVRWSVTLAQAVLVSVTAALVLALFGPGDTATRLWSGFAIAAFLGGIPVAYYTTQIYPEVLVGSLLLLSVALTRSPGRPSQWAGYVCLIVCLWGTARVLPGILAAAAVHLWRVWRDRDRVGAALLILGIGAYLSYSLWLWGYWAPPNPDPNSQCSLRVLPLGLLRNFFGNDVGMIWFCPAAWVGLACVPLALVYCRDDRGTLPALALWAGTAVTVGSFPNIRAGTCPAGRYQVTQCFLALLPVLIVLGGRAGHDMPWRPRLRFMLAVSGVLSLGIAAAVLPDPRAWYEPFHPLFHLERAKAWYGALPDFSGTGWPLRLACLAGVGTLAFFIPDVYRRLARRPVAGRKGP